MEHCGWVIFYAPPYRLGCGKPALVREARTHKNSSWPCALTTEYSHHPTNPLSRQPAIQLSCHSTLLLKHCRFACRIWQTYVISILGNCTCLMWGLMLLTYCSKMHLVRYSVSFSPVIPWVCQNWTSVWVQGSRRSLESSAWAQVTSADPTVKCSSSSLRERTRK